MKQNGNCLMNMAMAFTVCACAGCACNKDACSKQSYDDLVIGNWGLRLPYESMAAGHVIFSRDDNGTPKACCLHRWASPEWCRDVKIDGGAFSFVHPQGVLYRGRAVGGLMTGEILSFDDNGNPKERVGKFEGWRNPDIEPANTADAHFGEAIDLLKDGLDGWVLMNPNAKDGWSFKDGVLSNKLGLRADGSWAGGGSNLMSKRSDFYDFKLEYDVRVPAKSNSGVYLRGRYEIQVLDSYGSEVDRHNMAAYYGRVAPSVSAEKRPGVWQHVAVTLYRRHLTVVLNGVKIIDNAPVTGVTGGAIDAHEFVSGPIYLQGDHSDADFKNMILRPVL